MPWETPLQSIVDSVQGPVAKVIGVIIIVITGLTLAFGDTSGGFRRLIQIVFGLSVAFAASPFFLFFFCFGGGALVCCRRQIGRASCRESVLRTFRSRLSPDVYTKKTTTAST